MVLTLGLGIGANTAIFSLMDQVVLRPLAVVHPERLVQLDGPGPFSGHTENNRTLSYPMYLDLRDRNQVFDGLVARYGTQATLRVGAEAQPVNAELVSGNTFAVLGVRPFVGRRLTPEDDRTPGGHPVLMLGYEFWQRRFAGNPAVVGQAVVVNATPMTIIGVAPPRFAGVLSAQSPDLFVPLTMKAQMTPTWDELADRQTRWLSVVGRLKPGLTMESAKPQLDGVYRQANAHELQTISDYSRFSDAVRRRFAAKQLVLYPVANGLSNVRGSVSTPLVLLMAMVGLVLLIACANVANLLLTRATARQREIAMRLALGASRGRLARQTLTESGVLALAGAALGLVVSVWLGDLLLAVLPFNQIARFARHDARRPRGALHVRDRRPDGHALRRRAGVPGHAGEPQSHPVREQASGSGGGGSQARLRKGLVVAQVALSMLLVAGAGLFARSLANLRGLDPGFDTRHLVTFGVDPALSGYDQARIKRFLDRLVADVGQLPGVTAVTVAQAAVLTDSTWSRSIEVFGYTPKEGERLAPWTNQVGPGYFRTLGLALVAGREFTQRDEDCAPRVAVVNEAFARYVFGDASPLGRQFRFKGDPKEWPPLEIVGVMKDSLYATMRESEAGATPTFVYTPYAQSKPLAAMTAYVRTTPEAHAGIADRLRAVVRTSTPAFPSSTCSRWRRPSTRRSSRSGCSRCSRRRSGSWPPCSRRSGCTA